MFGGLFVGLHNMLSICHNVSANTNDDNIYGNKTLTQSYIYQSLNCHGLLTINAILTTLSLWISASLAFQRTLIELFFVKIFGTARKNAVIVSLVFFIFICLCRIPTILSKQVLPNSNNKSEFVCTFRQSSLLKRLEQSQSWLNMLGPCLVHFLSNILTCLSIVRRKVYLATGSNSQLTYQHAWRQQISLHRDYFIGPLVILLCQLPNLIMFVITDSMHLCIEPKLSIYSHLQILVSLLIYVPQMLTFIIFIYPSKYYISEFYLSTPVGRLITRSK